MWLHRMADVNEKKLVHHKARLAKTIRDPSLLPRAFNAKYEIVTSVGAGAFGMVVAARLQNSWSNKMYAVKVTRREDFPPDYCQKHQRFVMVPTESFLLDHLKHPNVIHLVDFYSNDEYFVSVTEMFGQDWRTPGQSEITLSDLIFLENGASLMSDDEIFGKKGGGCSLQDLLKFG